MDKLMDATLHVAKPPQVRTMDVFHRRGGKRGKVSNIYIDILGEDLFLTKTFSSYLLPCVCHFRAILKEKP